MREVRWEALAAPLILAAAVLVLAARAATLSATWRGASCRDESDYYVESGDALLRGVPLPGVARAMPFYSVPNAYLCFQSGPASSAAIRSTVYLAGAFVVFALGALLYSALCGSGAVLLYALLPESPFGGERWLYTLTVLLAAFFLVRRARAPSRAAGLALGAALGASLLVLSPLFLFPILLTAYEWTGEREPGSTRLGDAARLCAVPFAFLIPWIVMNWKLTGRLIPFEDGRADANLITGALGFVRTMGAGDPRALAGLSPSQSALAWAVLEVLRHPLRYLTALASRAIFVWDMHPWILLAAGVSAWLSRRREDCRRLSLLAGYLLAVLLSMPVQEGYFAPLWPLLAVLSAGLLERWSRPTPERLTGFLARAVFAVFAALLAAQAGVAGLVTAYPARARADGALERALAKAPEDPWLWSRRGLERLRSGQARAAAGDFARASALDPRNDRAVLYGWARLAAGGGWEDSRSSSSGMLADRREEVLRAIALVLARRRGEASAALSSARESALSAGELADFLPRFILEIVAYWPPPRRRELIEFFAATEGGRAPDAPRSLGERVERLRRWRSEIADLLLDSAEGAASVETASRILGLLEDDLPLDPERSRRAARAALAAGDRARALSLLKGLDLGREDEAFLREVGTPEAAAQAENARLDRDARRKMLLEQERGHLAAAMALADEGVRRRPGDGRWRSDRGVVEALSGRGDDAAADWKAALALDPDLPAPYLSLGSLAASRGRRGEAAALYERALRRQRIVLDAAAADRLLSERSKL
jgi:tetratricopeptide (TPR) repeat protein